jgi:hypothetical protein
MNTNKIKIKSGVIILPLLAAGLLAGCSSQNIRAGGIASSCDDRAPITFDEYKKLEGGQTLEEANAIFGCVGSLRLGVEGEGPFTIEWIGGAGGSTAVTAIFINGRIDKDGIQKYGL